MFSAVGIPSLQAGEDVNIEHVERLAFFHFCGIITFCRIPCSSRMRILPVVCPPAGAWKKLLPPLQFVAAQRIVQSRGMTLKSLEGTTLTSFVATVTCPLGHDFSPSNFRLWMMQGAGKPALCPICGDEKGRLQRLQAAAQKHGGLCLARSCADIEPQVMFQCAAGHKFETTAGSVLHAGTWCPSCGTVASAVKSAATTLSRAQSAWERDVAAVTAAGIKVLSFIHHSRSVRAICRNGHVFVRQVSLLAKSASCPICTASPHAKVAAGSLNVRALIDDWVNALPERPFTAIGLEQQLGALREISLRLGCVAVTEDLSRLADRAPALEGGE